MNASNQNNLSALRLERDSLILDMVDGWPQYEPQIEAIARQTGERFRAENQLREVQDYTFSREGLNEFCALCERIAFLERETVKQLKKQARV